MFVYYILQSSVSVFIFPQQKLSEKLEHSQEQSVFILLGYEYSIDHLGHLLGFNQVKKMSTNKTKCPSLSLLH